MAPERPLGVAPTEKEAARSPRFRLKRTVLVVMWLVCRPSETVWNTSRRERKRLCRSIYQEKSQVVSPRRSMFGVNSEPTSVPLDLLREITDNFSEERKLGSGSFGEVYLGVHQHGQKIAVKRIYEMAGVDDEQFQNEFTNLARLQHRNIVRLVGYCHHIQEVPAMYEGKFVLAEKIHRALCLEYMSNGSLEKYISDECNKYDWNTGYGIIKGICQGLKYLHTELKPPIYHLDLKPANVLLDENMVPRIADFGISRLFGDERTRATKSILGTQGYLPPEYIHKNLISNKFDIFSLGVVIIKIMAGRAGYYKSAEMSSHEFTNFVQEIWTNRLHETSSLMKAYSKQVKICIEIGLSCMQEDRHKRPTIQDIVDRLVPAGQMITGASQLTDEQTEYFSTADSFGTCLTDEVNQRSSSPNHDPDGIPYMQGQQAASLPSAVYEPPPRHVSERFPETGSATGVVKLCFDIAGPKDTLFTRCPVWKNGANAKVAILQNEKQITQGDLSKLQIEILPVHADFFTGQEDFTKDEFNKQIYMYKGKELVLATVSLSNGESSLGSFSFPESSHGKKLRLTARVKRQDLTVRVQEAITDPFVVKDRRSESNQKSPIPSKEDAIHQLKKICLKGKHWNNLVEKNITKVKHLLRHYHKDNFGLQKLAGMKKGDWNTMIEHATMCVPGDEIYSYWVPEDNCQILFNDFYDLVGKMTDNYVPYSVNDVDQFPQLKVKNWKMSAYKKFEELENSGGLIPDYFLSNGRLVPAAPPNNGASTSKNQTTAEFGEQQPFLQQSGFPLAQIFAKNVAAPSNQEGPPFAQCSYEQVAHQELYQQDPSILCNGIPPYLTHGNIDGQGSFSAWPISPSHNFAPAEEENSMTRANLTAQHNGYSSSMMTAAPGGVSQGTSSLNHDQAGISGLYPIEEWPGVEEAHVPGQDFIPADNAELLNSNNQSHGYEYDGGIW